MPDPRLRPITEMESCLGFMNSMMLRASLYSAFSEGEPGYHHTRDRE
ncbi:hypothetical protein JCM19236_5676 [Vibrio sp. JCM 19236]|nr:hypothetical protein JCM19236_5676 [Vibrio sp. JCM 19236]